MTILAKFISIIIHLSLNFDKIFVIFVFENMFSILVKFESEFQWIISFEKHKARDIWDRHISAELPKRDTHFSLLHRKPTPCMGN